MTSISEEEETLEAAVAGLPRVAEVVASIPEANRAKALDAAESAYRETVRDLGYEEGPAEAWVSAIMVRLQAEVSDKESVKSDADTNLAGGICVRVQPGRQRR